jgi:hypothetical protein
VSAVNPVNAVNQVNTVQTPCVRRRRTLLFFHSRPPQADASSRTAATPPGGGGYLTALTVLTRLTSLTADRIDQVDIVDGRSPTRSTSSTVSAVNPVNAVNKVNTVETPCVRRRRTLLFFHSRPPSADAGLPAFVVDRPLEQHRLIGIEILAGQEAHGDRTVDDVEGSFPLRLSGSIGVLFSKTCYRIVLE